jgi:hypothetical protein
MRFTRFAALLALALLTQAAFSQNYRTEITTDFSSTDSEFIDEDKGGRIAATYYFSPVEIRNHPLAEAAFLEKASNIKVDYVYSKSKENDIFEDISYRRTTTSHDVTGKADFYIPNSIFYVGAGIVREKDTYKIEFTSGSETYTSDITETDNLWFGSLGLTPIQGLLIWSDFYEDVDLDDHWNLNAKYVTDIAQKTVNIETSYRDYIDYYSASLIGDLYFNRTFSVGLGYSYIDVEDIDSYIFRSRKFFTDTVSIHAAFLNSDYSDTYNIGVDVRF